MLKPATWNRWIVGTWLLGFAAVRAGSPEERDPYWQIRAGLENLDGVPLARPDSWSWAPVEGLFYPNSPGWNVLLGLAWRLGGYWGFFLLSFAVLGGFLCLTYRVARRLGARPLPALAGLTICIFAAFPMLSARATTAVQLLLLIALVAPDLWRRHAPAVSPMGNAAVATVAGALISTIGNWIHLSWLTLSPLVAMSWAVYWLAFWNTTPQALGLRRLVALTLGGVTGLSVGPLASPYGVTGGIERTLETQRIASGVITEWMSPFTPEMPIQWPVFAVFAAAAAVATANWLGRQMISGRTSGPVAQVACIATVGLPFAVGGILAIRFMGLAVLTLAPIIAWGATAIADAAGNAAGRIPPQADLHATVARWTGGGAWRRVLTAVLALLSPGIVWLGPVQHARPAELGAVASALPAGCRFFGSAGTSGTVVLARPDVQVWVDGRADYYGRERLIQANNYFAGQGAQAAPDGATCVIFPDPASRGAYPRATDRINAEPGWDYRGRVNGFDVWVR